LAFVQNPPTQLHSFKDIDMRWLQPTLHAVAASVLGLALVGCQQAGGSGAATPTTAAAVEKKAEPPVLATPLSATTAAAAAKLRASLAEEQARYLKTLESLVNIESGSRDLEGLGKLASVIEARLKALGMTVESLPMKAMPFHPTLKGATLGSSVYGRMTGTGSKKVLLIAHMDTVYPKGMLARQPFRIDGDRAYGLGIADDKQGVALILHTLEMIKAQGITEFAELGVLINADEELGSPGSGALLTKLGGEYDAVFSYEGGGSTRDWVRLATSSIAQVILTVKGKASHAGAAPDAGRNAIYELSHQMLQTRDLGNKAKGLRINWTVAKGGEVRNVIPEDANAIADVRANSNADLDEMEAALNKAIQNKLIPDTEVKMEFFRSRPAFVANNAARALARHTVGVFAELGRPLEIRSEATGGGTDAAYAGLRPKGGVLESFGLRGFGAHSSDNEYVMIDSIQPRLYASVRMVMDVGAGRVSW
jgi:glutamate carboxypeptidase